MRTSALLAIPRLAAPPLAAQTCGIDLAAVEARIAEPKPAYGLVLSDIGCDASAPARGALWRMGRLDDPAWLYAVENATGQEVDRESPPQDPDVLAARDACTDSACR